MKIHLTKKVLGSLAMLAVILPFSSSASSMYQPAQFGDVVDQVTSKVVIPQSMATDNRTIAVYCQADIATTGAASNVTCFEKAGYDDLQGQTERALDGLAFTPAQVDGEAVPVRMTFRVVYSRNDSQPNVVMLPNMGTLQREYGVSYFAPQERLDNADWYSNYSDRGEGQRFFNSGQMARILGNVNAEGGVDSVQTIEARGRARRDARIIEGALKDSRFIPGFVGEDAVGMHYIAVVNYPGND
ncbi:hypothetical protein KO507_18760 [Gilvimarinus agarilyticus]|uniref:hypothetical protein n=1 Tax=unclassified Gilvimarinus TaxID=2642066 RepID=UPI001C0A51DF|nr:MULTISPECIES: hypothetical protein [unclassified Gilvimarinus]MBU2887812.1 hypothetical protein [Gilvimarinus agarilyticus]MDO6572451.1 hypothetical protein [Gilvimarinus sp. 2_MG-2023]MDO6746595.1 hypothetical protein [Gilvimarinus sp. 1_MG-2023]